MAQNETEANALTPEERLRALLQNDEDEMIEVLGAYLERDGRIDSETLQILAFSSDDIEGALELLEERIREWGEIRGIRIESPGLADE